MPRAHPCTLQGWFPLKISVQPSPLLPLSHSPVCGMLHVVFRYSTHQTQGIKQTHVTRGANAFHTPSELVPHAEQSRFACTANAFTVSGTRASHATQMRVPFFAHAFHSRSKHSYRFVHMRSTLEECVAGSSSHTFFQEECTFVVNASSL